jgi:peptidoglycan glycosyltransferase
VLFARQLYVQAIAGPALAGNIHDPRTALLSAYRGQILARDGTVLATSTGPNRAYPYGRECAQITGYDSARYGTTGLEGAFDDVLSAHAAASNPIASLINAFSNKPHPPAILGASIVTTIDPHVQETLAEALAAYPRGAGIALDTRTGEVLALASVPTFDPAAIDRTFASLARNASSPLLDRATDGLYPPGSTFKIFIAGAALDAGTTSMNATFDDPGTLPVGNFVVHDNEGEATGHQDLTGAFALSSNVDFAQIALGLGADRWYEEAKTWRLGESTDFQLPVSRDRLPDKTAMAPGVLAQLGFGQADLLVTPVRMALIAATVATGGTEPRPYIVRAVRVDGHDETVAQPASLAQPISPQIASDLKMMMVAVVRRGTGTAAALPGVQVAGKTGTATNPQGIAHSWFVAFAPAETPRVAVAIVVENAGYGAAVALPIARRVLATALARQS